MSEPAYIIALRDLGHRVDELRFLENSDDTRELVEESRRYLRSKVLLHGRRPAAATVVYAGGTNVGKSTIFNIVAGSRVACPTQLARGTKCPVAYVHRDLLDDFAASGVLEGYTREPCQRPEDMNEEYPPPPRLFILGHAEDALKAVALVDSPDLDSSYLRNHLVATDLLFAADAVVFVTSNQKYRDEASEDFLCRAARLRKRLVLVMNYSLEKAAKDFRSRAASVAPGAPLIEVPFHREIHEAGGPWRKALRDAIAGICKDAEEIKRESLRGALLALPGELRPVLDLYRREVDIVQGFLLEVGRAAERRAELFAANTKSDGIPEMDEILIAVMKELRVPGVDALYDALFETARGVWNQLRRLAGFHAKGEAARAAREEREVERLRRHLNAFADDIREVIDLRDVRSRDILSKVLPPPGTGRVREEDERELLRSWQEERRAVVEKSRDVILAALDDQKVFKTAVRTLKAGLRAASLVAMVHVGPNPYVDIGGSAALDLGLRHALDKVFGTEYRSRVEANMIDALRSAFERRLGARFIEPIAMRVPQSHTHRAYAALEDLLEDAAAGAGKS